MKQYKPRTKRMAQLVEATFSSINMPVPHNEIKVDRHFTPAIVHEELTNLGYALSSWDVSDARYPESTIVIVYIKHSNTDEIIRVKIDHWTFEISMKGELYLWD